MASQTVSALAARATAALRGQAPLGGSILVIFPGAGRIYIGIHNDPTAIPDNDPSPVAECILTLSLDTLAGLEDGSKKVFWAVLDGDLKVSGDRALAEKFGTLIKGAQPA